MNKVIGIALALCALVVCGADMPRSEWQGRVGEAATKPEVVKEIITQLSPADKKAFLAEVNKAIAALPVSPDRKAAYYLDANKMAVASAGKVDRQAVLTEVFATVPLEVLTVISEDFAKTIFNRDGAAALSDAEYTELARETVAAVSERCENVENNAQRDTCAVLMFELATGSSSDEYKTQLQDTLVEALPAEARKPAAEQWLPAALGTGQTQSYAPLLGELAEGGTSTPEEPNHQAVIQISSVQLTEVLLDDLRTEESHEVSNPMNSLGIPQTSGDGSTPAQSALTTTQGGATTGDAGGGGSTIIPRDVIYNPTTPDGSTNPYYSPDSSNPHPNIEPTPYPGQ